MDYKEKSLEIYERNFNITRKYLFNGHHTLAVEISINEAIEMLNSFNENYSYSLETENMEWTSDDSWLFKLHKDFWTNVVKDLRKHN
tara:strand:- start:49 stop:309 length:261 start_codon:yes stop_codon:yes gene_type:complete